MSFRKRGSGGKRDRAEGPIVDALRDLGCRVWYLSGQGNPDLLVLKPGPTRIYVPLEVKSHGGTLTKNQQDVPWAVVRGPQEAIEAIFG